MILLGILAAGFGIALIVFRDFFWQLTRLGNQFEGQKSERTELWDTGQILSGLVLIGIGAFVICAGVGEAQTEARETAEATGTAATALAELDSAFGPHIPEWQRDGGAETIMVNPQQANIRADRILYGRCSDNGFYLLVIGFNNQRYNDYAYLTDTTREPSDCAPQGARFFWESSSLGGGWYDVSLSGSLDSFGTPTATRVVPSATPTQPPVVIVVTATPTQTPIYIVVTATPAEEPDATEAE